jgi:hypothetical protein
VSFDAESAAETLDFDFTKYLPGVKGTIPEPSQAQIDAFAKANNAASGVDPEDDDAVKESNEKLLDALVKFCSGAPTKAQLKKLPKRVQTAFFGWLFGMFLKANPTKTSGTSS